MCCAGRGLILQGAWSLAGQLQTPWDTFTLDSTSFVHQGRHWLAWAQKEPGIDTNSNLYLAPLATPTTFAQPRCGCPCPNAREIRGFKVNEAPAVLIRHGRLFMTYSASATDARYCMGMLTAPADADLMDAKVWHKSSEPVFVSSPDSSCLWPGSQQLHRG
jgi:GH43 family beta-xylosidase